uniref:HDC18673 n=1 Tax=Drosophila melanogaster TaxID=7227 RepID=Q6IID6_DROME|nr:TPA_inf: HDC18673 [Drosophila melanogaster]
MGEKVGEILAENCIRFRVLWLLSNWADWKRNGGETNAASQPPNFPLFARFTITTREIRNSHAGIPISSSSSSFISICVRVQVQLLRLSRKPDRRTHTGKTVNQPVAHLSPTPLRPARCHFSILRPPTVSADPMDDEASSIGLPVDSDCQLLLCT